VFKCRVYDDLIATESGRDADPSPPSIAEVKNMSRAIPLLSLRTFVAYDRVKPT